MKHIIAAAGLTAICATTGAWAQSSVTLYGSLDAGIAYISNAGGHSKWIEEQGNMQPDRWGLKGVEDLGALFNSTEGATARADTDKEGAGAHDYPRNGKIVSRQRG